MSLQVKRFIAENANGVDGIDSANACSHVRVSLLCCSEADCCIMHLRTVGPAGAAGDPVDSGMFIFKDVTKEQVEEYVQSDDYVKNGLVSSWSIKPYHVVVGNP